MLAEGLNPLVERRAQRTLQKKQPTFGIVAAEFLVTHQKSWGSDKHKKEWKNTLETYAQSLWNIPIDQVDTAAVIQVLQPLWQEKFETASRLRGRIEAILDAARVAGHTPADRLNPARWKGHLAHLLPKSRQVFQKHHLALPYQEIPAFFHRLQDQPSTRARALQFLVLTATRTGEVLGATWEEIDFPAEVWIIPRTRMKAGKEHRVPLSTQALAVLAPLQQTRLNEFVFPGRRRNCPLGATSLVSFIRQLNPTITVHGLRSTFRTWAGDQTDFAHEVCEEALAHSVGTVERAYRRSDLLEKRRVLMQSWGNYVMNETSSLANKSS